MSGNYQGRRGPNASGYLQNLNAISDDEPVANSIYNPDDLALYTNSNFFDWDLGQVDGAGDSSGNPAGTSSVIDPSLKEDGMELFVDFKDLENFDYSFDFNTGSSSRPPRSASTTAVEQSSSDTTTTSPGDSYNPTDSSPTPAFVPSASVNGSRATKRKASTANLDPSAKVVNMEEASRLAAEEDKRRRNTAASARFRVKKKQREQALEKTAKEMTERVSVLEEKIAQLEMENQLLKNLIVEKNGKKDGETERTESPSIVGKNTDGVGTLDLVKSEN